MTDTASISLKVNTSSLEQATHKLGSFKKSAAEAAAGADKFSHSGKKLNTASSDIADQLEKTHANLKKLTDEVHNSARATQDSTGGLSRQREEFRKLVEQISPATAALNRLEDMQAKLNAINKGGAIDFGDYQNYNYILEQTREKLWKVIEAETAEGQAKKQAAAAAREAAAAEEKAWTNKQKFIEQLREQAILQGKTNAEILEYKAAQLGVSAQASPFINKLKQQEAAFAKGAISAGQYRQAMRMLPAQITDITTSLVSGMPIWMVAIQQGGQIKDSFGGIGNAAKAMLTMLTPARLLIGGLAGVLATVAIAAYQGASEAEEFNKQLILTRNYAGVTTGQLIQMSESLSKIGYTQAAASKALAQAVGAGFKADQLETVTRAALAMEKTTGRSIDETIKQFQKLYDEPTKASEELNNQLHYLTAAQYDYISSLERRGDKEAAGAEAAKLAAAAQEQAAKKVIDNMGWMEKSAFLVANAANKMWDALAGIGRPEAVETQLDKVRARIKEYEDYQSGFKLFGDRSEELAELRVLERTLITAANLQQDVTKATAEAQKDQEKHIEGIKAANEWTDRFATNSEKRAKELAKFWADVAKAPEKYSQSMREQIVKGINEQYADKKTPKTKKTASFRDDSATRMLMESNQRIAALKQEIALGSEQATKQDAQLTKFKQLIEDINEKIKQGIALTEEQKSLYTRRDEITASLTLEAQLAKENEQRKQGIAAIQKMSDYATELAERNEQAARKFGLTDKQASRVDQEAQLDKTYLKSIEGISDPQRLQKVTAEYNKAKAELRKGWEQEDERQGDWLTGMKSGINEYNDSAYNVFMQTRELAFETLGNMSNMMTELVTTGKANVKDFTKTFLTSLLQIINQLLVAKAIQASMGWLGIGSSSGGIGKIISGVLGFADGGYTGHGAKYQEAGIVHKGEFVFNKEATERIGVQNLYALMKGYADGGQVGNQVSARVSTPAYGLSGSSGGGDVNISGITVVVQNQGTQQQNNGPAVDAAYRQVIEMYVRKGIQQETKDGGIIAVAIKRKG
ncbi:phage tail tape measure protein [Yersinia enterocolitica]|uniref:phage tail tape measure protein n=1 Tax=Yersinia enterocolitica TaxID=630 RepID=UPI0025AAD67E|nr:phage tail tape measure protein [Yersinia enterocolitica]MDN0097749.1 phage tail tape measure protein [Yersinia enterocolitica]HEI6731261.1 phage tail tape measure protein [Yersinia enterocolitica]HEI6739851.1 phage tail tape measure protein [Yersinia enterocolitica]HEI6819007.1 phage tail tape measure protein [Yersinia enterocolitica]